MIIRRRARGIRNCRKGIMQIKVEELEKRKEEGQVKIKE